MQLPAIADPLLAWYDRAKRDLPWRAEPTPYHVWVSEVMLQQTRVEAVKPYYFRFLQALPDVQALADCPEERLLKLWEGLGYYNRVRNMQRAAREICSRFGGQLPRTYEDWLALPGIGEYTAGAIASFAYGARVPAVDGNVLRVAARLTGSEENVLSPATRRAVTAAVAERMPTVRCGDFNQALIELGALVCAPNGGALCTACPLQSLCVACREGSADRIPVRSADRPRKIQKRTVLILRDGPYTAVRRRPDTGLLAGLYELPGLEGHLTAEEVACAVRGMGLEPLRVQALPDARHLFSHVEWQMRGFAVQLAQRDAAAETGDLVFADAATLAAQYAIPSAFRAFMQYLDITVGAPALRRAQGKEK